ncbi:MAG: sodium:dicarboxylate symporter [Bacteroidetes bacterium]|nr:sodium:dicarboxylate symporter [Bacteroidota bacterium]
MKNILLRNIALLSALIIGVLTYLQFNGWIPVPASILTATRVLLLLPMFWFGWQARSLTTWVFIAMVAGVVIGVDFPDAAKGLNVTSKLFLRLVKMIIAPLLFATLVVGIAGHSNLKQVGRMGLKAIIYFEIVTTLALFIGLAAINISQAGSDIKKPATIEKPEQMPDAGKHFQIYEIVPENIAKAVSENNVLQVVIFSILFAIAISMCAEEYKKPVVRFAEILSEVMFKLTNLVMLFSPFAVGGAIAFTIGSMGLGIFRNFALLLLTLAGALLFFLFGVLLPIALYFKVPLKKFLQAVEEPVSVAFATASSDAALPKAMSAMEKLGVHKKVYSFVLPMGYSFNLDGTTLYLSLAAIFVAQASGVQLPFSTQLYILLTLMLTSKGVAGVAKASFVILLGTIATFHLPEWPVYMIFGVDAIMDMARTSVNVLGNCLATVIIAKSEGEFVEGV